MFQAYRRGMEDRWDRLMYVRDKRLTGNPYVQNVSIIEEFYLNIIDFSLDLFLFQGLESITDEK